MRWRWRLHRTKHPQVAVAHYLAEEELVDFCAELLLLLLRARPHEELLLSVARRLGIAGIHWVRGVTFISRPDLSSMNSTPEILFR